MNPIIVLALASALNPDQQEQFLRTAKVTASRTLETGVTESRRVTLSSGTMEHDAHVQRVDNFYKEARQLDQPQLHLRDSWMYNVAAYRLAQLLGLSMVPVTVERRDIGGSASVTWWLDDVLMDEAARQRDQITPPDRKHWSRQMETVRVFDQLIYNLDRNTGNLIITKDWKLWMIDHTRAFRLHRTLPAPSRIQRCDRTLLTRLYALDEPMLSRELKPYLTGSEIRALLARRDEIVKLLEQRRRELGESYLFDLNPTPAETAAR